MSVITSFLRKMQTNMNHKIFLSGYISKNINKRFSLYSRKNIKYLWCHNCISSLMKLRSFSLKPKAINYFINIYHCQFYWLFKFNFSISFLFEIPLGMVDWLSYLCTYKNRLAKFHRNCQNCQISKLTKKVSAKDIRKMHSVRVLLINQIEKL